MNKILQVVVEIEQTLEMYYCIDKQHMRALGPHCKILGMPLYENL